MGLAKGGPGKRVVRAKSSKQFPATFQTFQVIGISLGSRLRLMVPIKKQTNSRILKMMLMK